MTGLQAARWRGDESGRGVLGSLLRIVAVLSVMLILWQSLELLYRYYDLRNQLAHVVSSADLEPDSELRKKIASVTKRAGIECAEQDIVLTRVDKLIRLELSYRHPVALPLPTKHFRVGALPLRLTVEQKLLS